MTLGAPPTRRSERPEEAGRTPQAAEFTAEPVPLVIGSSAATDLYASVTRVVIHGTLLVQGTGLLPATDGSDTDASRLDLPVLVAEGES